MRRLTSSESTAGWVAPVIAEYVRLPTGMQVDYRPSDPLLGFACVEAEVAAHARPV